MFISLFIICLFPVVALYASQEAMHSFEIMLHGVLTFSTIENLMLGTSFFSFLFTTHRPPTQVASSWGRITPQCDLLPTKQGGDACKNEALGSPLRKKNASVCDLLSAVFMKFTDSPRLLVFPQVGPMAV